MSSSLLRGDETLEPEGFQQLKIKDLKIKVGRLVIPKKRRNSSGDIETDNKKLKIGNEEVIVDWTINGYRKYMFTCHMCRKNFKDATALAYHEIHHPQPTKKSNRVDSNTNISHVDFSRLVLPPSVHPLLPMPILDADAIASRGSDRSETAVANGDYSNSAFINGDSWTSSRHKYLRVKSPLDIRIPTVVNKIPNLVDTNMGCEQLSSKEKASVCTPQQSTSPIYNAHAKQNGKLSAYEEKVFVNRRLLRRRGGSLDSSSLLTVNGWSSPSTDVVSPPSQILKFVKIDNKKWRVNETLSPPPLTTPENLSACNGNGGDTDIEHTVSDHQRERGPEPEVLRYVKASRKRKRRPSRTSSMHIDKEQPNNGDSNLTVTSTQESVSQSPPSRDERLDLLVNDPKFFDEDDFDIVMDDGVVTGGDEDDVSVTTINRLSLPSNIACSTFDTKSPTDNIASPEATIVYDSKRCRRTLLSDDESVNGYGPDIIDNCEPSYLDSKDETTLLNRVKHRKIMKILSRLEDNKTKSPPKSLESRRSNSKSLPIIKTAKTTSTSSPTVKCPVGQSLLECCTITQVKTSALRKQQPVVKLQSLSLTPKQLIKHLENQREQHRQQQEQQRLQQRRHREKEQEQLQQKQEQLKLKKQLQQQQLQQDKEQDKLPQKQEQLKLKKQPQQQPLQQEKEQEQLQQKQEQLRLEKQLQQQQLERVKEQQQLQQNPEKQNLKKHQQQQQLKQQQTQQQMQQQQKRQSRRSASRQQDGMKTSRDSSLSGGASSENGGGSDRRFSERRFQGEKPYMCNHCPLTFSSLDNRVVHERTHREKPFECAFCEMRFSFELSLKRHIKIHK